MTTSAAVAALAAATALWRSCSVARGLFLVVRKNSNVSAGGLTETLNLAKAGEIVIDAFHLLDFPPPPQQRYWGRTHGAARTGQTRRICRQTSCCSMASSYNGQLIENT